MVRSATVPHSTVGIAYKDFRKLIHKSSSVAECLWESIGYEKRCNLVWKAAKRAHLDVLKWTLQPVDNDGDERECRRTRIDGRNLRSENEGWTLLHFVCVSSDENVRKLLSAFQLLILWAGCPVNARDNKGETPFHQVCGSHVKRDWKGRRIYIRLLRLLIEHGADVNEPVQVCLFSLFTLICLKIVAFYLFMI